MIIGVMYNFFEANAQKVDFAANTGILKGRKSKKWKSWKMALLRAVML